MTKKKHNNHSRAAKEKLSAVRSVEEADEDEMEDVSEDGVDPNDGVEDMEDEEESGEGKAKNPDDGEGGGIIGKNREPVVYWLIAPGSESKLRMFCFPTKRGLLSALSEMDGAENAFVVKGRRIDLRKKMVFDF